MIIPIDDHYRIQTDEHSWQVAQRRPNGRWLAVTYHADLSQAARSLYDRQLRASDAIGAAEVLAEAERLLDRLSLALAPQFEVREVVP
jgi:hypothetical protein